VDDHERTAGYELLVDALLKGLADYDALSGIETMVGLRSV
jgi:hypothetical protein